MNILYIFIKFIRTNTIVFSMFEKHTKKTYLLNFTEFWKFQTDLQQQKLPPPNGSVIGVHTHTLGRHPHSHAPRPQQIIHQSSSCSRSNSPADNRPLLSSSSQSSSATTATISSQQQQQTQTNNYQQGIPKAAMDEMRVWFEF